MRYRIRASATLHVDYTCRQCATMGTTLVRARGSSHEFGDGIFDPLDADTRARLAAEHDLHHDAKRIVGLIRCPVCGQRAPNAVVGSALRFAMLCVPSAFLLILGLQALIRIDATDDFAWVCVVLGIVALLLLRIETSRWREAERARALMSCVERPRERKPPVRAQRSVPIAVPIAVVPPPPDPAPPSLDEGPRFLRDG